MLKSTSVQWGDLLIMSTDNTMFRVNKSVVTTYITITITGILAYLGMLASIVYALTRTGAVTGGVFWLVVGVIMSLVALFIMVAFLQNLVSSLRRGGPALIVTDQGICYRFASDDFVPWSKIRKVIPFFQGGMKAGVLLELKPDFSETFRWRGAIANSYKADRVTVRFWFIDASNREIEQAISRHAVIGDY